MRLSGEWATGNVRLRPIAARGLQQDLGLSVYPGRQQRLVGVTVRHTDLRIQP